MYVRKSLSRNGRYFLSFVQGYRVDGKIKQKTIENIGWLDELEKKFDDPIAHFKEIAKLKNKEVNEDKTIEKIKNEKLLVSSHSRFNLGYIIPKKIYSELGLKSFFNSKQKALNIDYNLNDIFSILVFSRILFHGS